MWMRDWSWAPENDSFKKLQEKTMSKIEDKKSQERKESKLKVDFSPAT